MSRTSKSPRKVALEALAAARQALPSYGSRFSRHDFTLAQHFACLVLKSFFRTDYRGVSAILTDLPDLCAALEMTKVPHFTTLHKAHARLLAFGPMSDLLDCTVRRALGERPRVEIAAGDSTGLESSQISPYFVRRRGPRPGTTQGTSYTRYPKLELLCDCRTHVIVSAVPTLGPRPDTDRMAPLLFPALSRGVGIGCALFDAGYDSEPNHRFARQACHVRARPFVGIEPVQHLVRVVGARRVQQNLAQPRRFAPALFHPQRRAQRLPCDVESGALIAEDIAPASCASPLAAFIPSE